MSATPCPDARTLERLLLGHLSGPQAEQLEAHVLECPRCVQVAQSLQADDALVLALHDADTLEPSPEQPLIDAVIPVLKRLRPSDQTQTLAPGDTGGERGSASTTGLPGPLTPADTPGVLGMLGAYRVLRELGAGGMGVVYLAEDPQLKRQIALKVIRPELMTRTDLRERFLREAQAVAAVEHDHIVAIFHVGEHGGVPYLAMPLLRRPDAGGTACARRRDRCRSTRCCGGAGRLARASPPPTSAAWSTAT